MNYKITVLLLGLLFILSVSSVYAIDSNDIAIDNNVNETILIDGDVSICPVNQSIISATNKNTIFNVSSNATLNLSNLKLTNAKGVNGGAIYNKGTLILNNCIFISNEANCGGAIYNEGVLVLTNCIFISNEANCGGAIYNNGSMLLNNCTFNSNKASVSGGAIYNLQDNLTIQDATFIENYGKVENGVLQGGAIANYGDNLTVDNCSFEKNHLFNTGWDENGNMYGGAIYNSGNNLLVKNSRLNRNYIYGSTSGNYGLDLSYKRGGAVYSIGDISTFINNEFDSNELYAMYSIFTKISLSYHGIGSAIEARNKVIIINNTFLNNSAAAPPLQLGASDGSIILNNVFINNNARSTAQSIFIQGANVVISGNIFSRNENATDKGYFEDPDYWKVYEVAMEGVNYTISYNYFENSNGIYYINAAMDGNDTTANLTITHNIFNNTSSSISIDHGNNIDIDSNVFINSDYAIHTYTGRYLNIKNNYFYGGSTSTGSKKGYITINSHFTVISGNVFKDIGAEDSLHPIISLMSVDNVTIEDNSFTGIKAGQDSLGRGTGIIYSLFGGYAYIPGLDSLDGPLGIVEVNNNYFANNSITGGALFDLIASKINIEDNIIEDNDALIMLSNSTSYKTQYVNFTNNQIKYFSGDIWEYTYFLNSKNLVEYDNNRDYIGDSSSFLDKILDFLQELIDEYSNPDKVVDSEKTDINKNVSDSSSEISNWNLTNAFIEEVVNSTVDQDSSNSNSVVDSDAGNTIANSYSSQNMNNPIESKANVGDTQSSSSDSSSKSYEIKKPSVSKEINDNNYLIGTILIFIVIFALLAYGYKRK